MFKLTVISTTATFDATPSSAQVDEGMTFVVNLATTGVQNGQVVPYTITGIQAADIDGVSLTGEFTVQNGAAFKSFHVTADALAEGAETMTLTLDGLGESTTVVFNDLTAGDPYWNQVSLLLPLDSNFTDVSPSPVAVTLSGNTSISTTAPKFGAGSAYFDGFGDYATIQDTSDRFDFGTGDFTVEAWVKITLNNSNWQTVLIRRVSGQAGGFGLYVYSLTPKIYLSSSAGSWDLASALGTTAIAQNTWSHLAIVRNGTTISLYVNGTLSGSITTSASLPASTLPLSLGASSDGSETMAGYIDSVRVTKGVARYTAPFTPPTEAFPTV